MLVKYLIGSVFIASIIGAIVMAPCKLIEKMSPAPINIEQPAPIKIAPPVAPLPEEPIAIPEPIKKRSPQDSGKRYESPKHGRGLLNPFFDRTYLYPNPNDAAKGNRPHPHKPYWPGAWWGGDLWDNVVGNSHIDWKQYETSLENSLRSNHKPFFIHFTGNYCLTCKAQAPYLDNQEVADKMKEKGIVPLRVILDDDIALKDEKAAMAKYGVPYVPAYVYVNEKGEAKVVDQIWSKDTVLEMLNG